MHIKLVNRHNYVARRTKKRHIIFSLLCKLYKPFGHLRSPYTGSPVDWLFDPLL